MNSLSIQNMLSMFSSPLKCSEPFKSERGRLQSAIHRDNLYMEGFVKGENMRKPMDFSQPDSATECPAVFLIVSCLIGDGRESLRKL